jgi:hydroxyethylthiazole kinase
VIPNSDIKKQIIKAVEEVKQTNPMAGSITNSVTINFVANAQLAVGGSAAMVYLPDEGVFLAQAGGASYINVGTLLPIYEKSLPLMAKTLYDNKKAWVLDPVAVGIGEMRTQLLQTFKKYKPSIIRGNASEIIALAGLWELEGGTELSKVRGVDTTDEVRSAIPAAISLARWTNGAVAVSGQIDLITDGSQVAFSTGGSYLMTRITGAGCALGGVMAVYSAVAAPFVAALAGTAVFNLAGKRAESKVEGPGSFQTVFIDELYKASGVEIADNEFTLEEV